MAIKRKKKIIVKRGALSELAEIFDCSKMAVYNALNYVSMSKQACAIREMAIKKYGGSPSYWKSIV